jgi:small subunit ribosomal protein S6
MTEHYEILYILPISLTPEETAPFVEKIAGYIKDNGGAITKDDNLGKQKFAYPIKALTHGYYFLYEFDLPKAHLSKLNRSIQLMPEVVRYLIVKKRIKTEQDLADEKATQERLAKRKEKEIEKLKADKESSSAKATEDKDKKTSGKEKMSLEDLDKKLDEILDTDEIM